MIKISFCNVSWEDQLNLTREPLGAARLENRSGMMEGLSGGSTEVAAASPAGRERTGKEFVSGSKSVIEQAPPQTLNH